MKTSASLFTHYQAEARGETLPGNGCQQHGALSACVEGSRRKSAGFQGPNNTKKNTLILHPTFRVQTLCLPTSIAVTLFLLHNEADARCTIIALQWKPHWRPHCSSRCLCRCSNRNTQSFQKQSPCQPGLWARSSWPSRVACSLTRNKPYATRLQTVSELLGLHALHQFVNHARCIILGSNNCSWWHTAKSTASKCVLGHTSQMAEPKISSLGVLK